MDFDVLLSQPGIEDVLIAPDAVYVITSTPTKPLIFSEKPIIFIQQQDLLTSEHITDVLQATSTSTNAPVTSLRAYVLYEYSFSELKTTEKQRISHILNGTGGRKSLLEQLGAQRIGRGVIIVPKQERSVLEEFFTTHHVTYTTKQLLLEKEHAA